MRALLVIAAVLLLYGVAGTLDLRDLVAAEVETRFVQVLP
jgi:formate hydrogenlyase subunit 3/multisubunit Na+/H+ antiporter MnhD subunit